MGGVAAVDTVRSPRSLLRLGTEIDGEPEEQPGSQHASAVEALDRLRLLQPETRLLRVVPNYR